jgi:hypothetical protein
MPLRVILPVLSNFTSFWAYSIICGNVSGGPSRPASLNIARFQNSTAC